MIARILTSIVPVRHRLVFIVTLGMALGVATGIARADDSIILKTSDFSVAETIDRLEAIVSEKGFKVFARIDHAAGATSAGMELRPTQTLIFGNPKAGTPLMQSRQSASLDLPIRVAAWTDETGATWIAYTDPAKFASRHGIIDREEVIKRMTGALDKFTDAAAH